MIGGPFQKGIRQGRILSTSTSSAASPVGRRTCSEGALSFSRPRLASGVAGIAGRLLFGLEGDIRGALPGDLGIAGRLLGFRSGIAGGLLGGLMGNAGQPGSFALGSARIASDVDRVAGGLVFGGSRVGFPRSPSQHLPLLL